MNIVLSADNALMATACLEGTVRLWRLKDGRCLKIWRHGSQINCLTFDTMTCALIYGGEDGDCMVWDLSSLLFEEEDDDDDDDQLARGGGGGAGMITALTMASGQANDPIEVDYTPELGMGSSQRLQSRLRFTGQYPLLECALVDMNDRVRRRLIDSQAEDNGLSSGSVAATVTAAACEEESISACALSNLLITKDTNTGETGSVGVGMPAGTNVRSHQKPSASLTANQEAILQTNSELFSWNDVQGRKSYAMNTSSSSSSSTQQQQSTAPIRFLCLPHINADLKGDKISVESMDMCSVNCLLVTGGSDGIARVWRLNEPAIALDHQLSKIAPTTEWSQVPAEEGMLTAKRREKEKQDLEILRALNSAMCEPDKIEKLETVAYRQLCRLEGHVSAVTDVQFSHAGDRILTGSWKKDGTVRIWTFSKDFLKHEHLILSINENDAVDTVAYGQDQEPEQEQGQEGGGGGGGRGRPSYRGRGGGGNKPQIHNVYWSCDDATILVVHSFVPLNVSEVEDSEYCQVKREGTRMRVYNSTTGKLLKIITISFQKCHVLACHPSNPQLAFTAGKEGILSVWNVHTGERISQHSNQCPAGGLIVDNVLLKEESPIEIVDGKFSPDGLRIAATDVVGRVIVLGNDNPNRFTEVNDTQYFLSDYSTVIHDRQGWPIDADSQLPLHQAPVGPLCRTDCTPYANQPASFPLPQPLCREEASANLKELLFWRDRYPSTVSKAYNAHKKLMIRNGDNPAISSSSSSLPSMSLSSVSSFFSFSSPLLLLAFLLLLLHFHLLLLTLLLILVISDRKCSLICCNEKEQHISEHPARSPSGEQL